MIKIYRSTLYSFELSASETSAGFAGKLSKWTFSIASIHTVPRKQNTDYSDMSLFTNSRSFLNSENLSRSTKKSEGLFPSNKM